MMNIDLIDQNSWWQDLLACPSCGSQVKIRPFAELNCPHCKKPYQLQNKNQINWETSIHVKNTPKFSLIKGIYFVKQFLNPIVSPVLPFRYLSNLRIGNYYKRTLNDLQLAKKWKDHYFKGLNIPEGATILDHGCGRGRNMGLLKQLGYHFAGQDVTKHAWWNQLTGGCLQVIPGDCQKLPWINNSFDVVLDVLVIQQIPEKFHENVVTEVKRILKPGGCWIILEANPDSFGARHFLQSLVYLPEVQALATKHGFELVDISYEGFFAKKFPFFINYLRKHLCLGRFDISDYGSWIEKKIIPKKRAMWLLRLRNSTTKNV